MSTIVIVHPDDVNLADAKALAAKHDATVVGNRFCPRGQMLLTDSAVLDFTRPAPARPGVRPAGESDG